MDSKTTTFSGNPRVHHGKTAKGIRVNSAKSVVSDDSTAIRVWSNSDSDGQGYIIGLNDFELLARDVLGDLGYTVTPAQKSA